jgi:hypothetical protein
MMVIVAPFHAPDPGKQPINSASIDLSVLRVNPPYGRYLAHVAALRRNAVQ